MPHITRHAAPLTPPESSASTSVGTVPAHWALTRRFLQTGDMNVALGRSPQAPSENVISLLEDLERRLQMAQPSYSAIAQLSQELAESAKTEEGGRPLTDEPRQHLVVALINTCNEALANTRASTPAYDALTQAREALSVTRLHQAISQLTTDAYAQVRCLPDLLLLAQLAPEALADRPDGPSPYMLLGSFVRIAKHRSGEMIGNLQRNPDGVRALLRTHLDTVHSLNELPGVLSACAARCPDASTKDDISQLSDVVVRLLKRLHTALAEEITGEASSVAQPTRLAPAALRREALRTSATHLLQKFDAYGALAPMDDKALLTLMRRPAPKLTPEQMHAFLNKHVIELTEDQFELVNRTALSMASSDLEAGHLAKFDEKLRAALASGSLVLTEEQRAELGQQPKVDSVSSAGLRPLLEQPRVALSASDQQMLDALLSANAAGQLDAWLAHNQKLPEVLAQSGLPTSVRAELTSINQAMNAELSTLKNGASFVSRVAASPVMLLGLAPLPLAVAFLSGDKPYSSSLVAHFSKNAVFMAGLMMNGLTNSRTNLDHGLNRYFVTVLANVIVAQPTFAKNEHLLEKVGFGMATAVVSGGVTLGVFNRDAITAAIKTAKAKLFGGQVGEADIPEADHETAVRHFEQGEQIAQQFRLAVEVFKQHKPISDIMNSNLSHLLTKSSKIKAAYTRADAKRMNLDIAPPPRIQDPHFYPKMGLVVLTAGISAALVMLMESLVGKADYAADGTWCTSEMLKLALNSEVDMQKAVHTFKEIVGLNLVMTAFLGVNKAWDFLDKGAQGYAAGAAVLTAANLSVPGMVGEAAGSAAGKGLSYLTDKGKAAQQMAQAAVTRAGEYANTARRGGPTNAVQTRNTQGDGQNAAALVGNAVEQWYALDRRRSTALPTGEAATVTEEAAE